MSDEELWEECLKNKEVQKQIKEKMIESITNLLSKNDEKLIKLVELPYWEELNELQMIQKYLETQKVLLQQLENSNEYVVSIS